MIYSAVNFCLKFSQGLSKENSAVDVMWMEKQLGEIDCKAHGHILRLKVDLCYLLDVYEVLTYVLVPAYSYSAVHKE